ncbi:MAG: aminopeptidase P N-terminal domain-containing protein [Candidatus Delongbacteria bacterium]|jgi:Xaa-Pro aminopeptidase|nr:aminopeptidase P N-terminal domain-containing protein [Candidatus Delongbacteria bacterium]
MRYPSMPELFKKNRHKLFDTMQTGETAIVVSNVNYPRNGDQYYPFRQDSDFFWLTGIEQDWSYLIMHKHKDAVLYEALLIKETNKQIRLWDGPRLDKPLAGKVSGIKDVYWMDELEPMLKKYISKSRKISLNLNESRKINTVIQTPGKLFYDQFSAMFSASGKYIADICPRIHKLRVVKEPEEIDFIRKAIDITHHAYLSVLQNLKPGMTEYQVEAIIRHEMLNYGVDLMSFAPIIAAGENACVLHYTKNDKTCEDGELLLMDFGAEYLLYPSDCSRTIPVNGRYSKRQKQIYEAVLEVYYEALKLFKPGETINGINNKTALLMEKKLRELGLLSQEDIENQDEQSPAYKRYFPHGTTHFIGLDVHDVGGKDVPFKPGMVMSCEPGIYIEHEGIGVRIETDVLITKNGCEDLMADFPVEVEDIEKMM